MRARFNKNTIDNLKEDVRYLDSKEKINLKLDEVLFPNKKLYVEIGMGKGNFIINKANIDEDNIYLGVELCLPVLAQASKKIKKFEEENKRKLDNLYIASFDALNISDVLGKHKTAKIFLNFSDPWPKKKHAKRRLTNERFLQEYKKVMAKDSTIEFKTDNRGLFEYSLLSMQKFGFEFSEVYLDLHKENVPNVVTEYEEKFSKFGPIYKLVVK